MKLLQSDKAYVRITIEEMKSRLTSLLICSEMKIVSDDDVTDTITFLENFGHEQ